MRSEDEASEALVAAARALGPQIRAGADQAERDREVPRPQVDALADAGFFHLLVPRTLGGGEVDPLTLVRVIEAAAAADASAGWYVMVAAAGAIMCSWLGDDASAGIFGPPNAYAAGVSRRTGRAQVVDGGYRVSGRWAFASGCRHATWVWVASLLYDGDAPVLGADGKPVGRIMFVPIADVAVVDTWHVSGLCATGSHDVVVDDVFVPADRSLSLGDPPRRPGPVYTLGASAIYLAVAAVPLGIARHAIDAFIELAGAKTPHLGAGMLRERPIIHAHVGRAEAHLRAGRALVFESARDAWQAVRRTGELSPEHRALIRLTAAEATSLAVQATERMHRAGGATAILRSSPLDRCWRDIQAAARNIAVTEDHFAAVGKLLLEATAAA